VAARSAPKLWVVSVCVSSGPDFQLVPLSDVA
jgi:hypothetical protein